MRPAVRDADQHLRDAELLADLTCSAAQCHTRTSAELIADLNVLPTDSARPARSQSFEDCLLGGKTARVMLRGGLPRTTVFDLMGRKDAHQEQLTVTLNHLRDAQTFDDVGANADDIHNDEPDSPISPPDSRPV